MVLEESFEKAVADSKILPVKPGNDILLQLYSLYKQATKGDNTDDAPTNPFDFINKAKHDAWAKLQGLSTINAMKQYVALVEEQKKQ